MKFPFTAASDRTFDVLGFGTNAVDYLITVPEYPEFSSKIELREYARAAGGEVASTMAGLQRLGFKTAYAGSFGSDVEGEFGMRSLRDECVDLSFSRQVPGAKTQLAFILIDLVSGERTVIWKRDPFLAWPPDTAPVEAAEAAAVVHMTPHDTGASIELAQAARSAGTIVSLDIDNVFDRVEELLPLVDILICSSEFPKRLTGHRDHRVGLQEISSRFGNGLIGVTLGEDGSLLLCGENFVETSGFAVPGGCKDTTGAGDAFRTGLLYGFLKGESVETAAVLANAVAALKCREIGARTALPNSNELRGFLKNS